MTNPSRDEYQAAIPPCCALRTVDEHLEMLGGCWGLMSAMKSNKPMDCRNCEFFRESGGGNV